MFRLILSIIIGFSLGRNRKRHHKDAGGGRTLAIVSMVSCLIAIISLKIEQVICPNIFNFSRMMAYSIVGISFLCSAVIHQTKKDIEGTTTSVAIWACVPINIAIGLGFCVEGIISAIFVYLILESKYWK